ncbi:ADP-ribosylation factor-like protein 2-binding protein [Parasteatoda tepidariorum]|uniref:ADP-ribosylation factor-like protein 2-binding protein n=1 Tax=Parasteatoda tepidariorum TaxID=114398 RepID=UPI00077FDDD2|nr:ADP-ribosylation factor-like protein 2-binding protein [Parasteatoda tepidariorum]XP_015920862.1 ADP-ribosylation factor-like protein 2-binding protein [Parasteatoda tepidariorum]
MAEEEELVCNWNDDNNHFDVIIGHIEDIIIDPEFVNLQNDFMNRHYEIFEECEENKLEYMDIFNSYTELIEKHIETSLLRRMPEFSMKDFLKDIAKRHSELEGDVFDILVSFTDFISFKEMFLDYKAAKTGCTPDLSIQNSTKECSLINSK